MYVSYQHQSSLNRIGSSSRKTVDMLFFNTFKPLSIVAGIPWQFCNGWFSASYCKRCEMFQKILNLALPITVWQGSSEINSTHYGSFENGSAAPAQIWTSDLVVCCINGASPKQVFYSNLFHSPRLTQHKMLGWDRCLSGGIHTIFHVVTYVLCGYLSIMME